MAPPTDWAPGQPLTVAETLSMIYREILDLPRIRFAPDPIVGASTTDQALKFGKMEATTAKEVDLAFAEAAWRFFSGILKTLLRAELVYSIFPSDTESWQFIAFTLRNLLGPELLNTLFSGANWNTSAETNTPATYRTRLLITWLPVLIELIKEIYNARSRFTIARNNSHTIIKHGSKRIKYGITKCKAPEPTLTISVGRIQKELLLYLFGQHSFEAPPWPTSLPMPKSIIAKIQVPSLVEFYSDLSSMQVKANKILRNILYALIEHIFAIIVFSIKARPSFTEEPVPIILNFMTAVLGIGSLLMISRIKLSQIDKMRNYYLPKWDLELQKHVGKKPAPTPTTLDIKPQPT